MDIHRTSATDEIKILAREWANSDSIRADKLTSLLDHVRATLESIQSDVDAGLISGGRGLMAEDIARHLGISRKDATLLCDNAGWPKSKRVA